MCFHWAALSSTRLPSTSSQSRQDSRTMSRVREKEPYRYRTQSRGTCRFTRIKVAVSSSRGLWEPGRRGWKGQSHETNDSPGNRGQAGVFPGRARATGSRLGIRQELGNLILQIKKLRPRRRNDCPRVTVRGRVGVLKIPNVYHTPHCARSWVRHLTYVNSL